MRKIYFLSLLLISTLTFGQNLLLNGDVETWVDTTTPSDWTHVENIEQETTTVHGGTYSAKHTGGTKDLGQTATGIIPGKTYNISLWYKVETGDGTDARIWSYWRDSADANVTDANTDAALRGPNNAYFDNNGNVWTEYNVNVVAPAGVDRIYFELRTYGGAVVYWDDMSITCVDCGSAPAMTITSPTDGTVFAPTTTSVDVPLNISNFQVGATTAGLDGHIHYVLTTDGTAGTQVMKYDDTPINLTVAAGSDYSLYVELVDNSHTAISPAVNATVTFSVADYTSVTDLAALRADYIADPAAGADKYYQVATSPVITYSRASRNQKYIQDTTAGILIDDNDGIMPYNDGSTTDPVDGDALSGLVGQVSTYGGVLQFVPAQAATIASSGNTITPEVVTIADITANQADYESELVQITGVTFADGDGTNTFTTSTNYDITDTTTMVFRTIFSEADYVVNAEVIPSVATDLVALVAQYNGTPQVVARSIADISVLGTNSFDAIDGLAVYPNPIANGAVLNITSASNNAMTVQIFDILGKEVSNTAVINNNVEIANLNSGVYIVKISQDGKTATRKLVVK